MRLFALLLLSALLASSLSAAPAPLPRRAVRERPDPVVGKWQGRVANVTLHVWFGAGGGYMETGTLDRKGAHPHVAAGAWSRKGDTVWVEAEGGGSMLPNGCRVEGGWLVFDLYGERRIPRVGDCE